MAEPRLNRLARSAIGLAATLSVLALAPAASAGQIVWSTDNAIWAMNDDGSNPHQLVAASAPALRSLLPAGTLTEPDVFQGGGTSVLFLGVTSHFASASLPAACGADCSGTFELSGGRLRELGPKAGPASGAAYYESQPRVTADGQEIFDSTLTTGILTDSPGAVATALVERPLALNATVTQWSDTDSATEPAAGFDPAPDPAQATTAAWVEEQGCGFSFPNAQGVAQPSCQYAVHLGSASETAAPIVIYDNEFVSANGRGPSSLSLSSDGSTLLLVDPYAPNTGIFTTPVTGTPGSKPVTEVLAQPTGWTFGQARFAGARIVFDAHQQVGGRTTGDIYTIPATCGSTSVCTFPASATDLTHDPLADSADPAWTSATAPLAALSAPAQITAASGPASAVRPSAGATLVVKLSAPATITVRLVRRAGVPPRSTTIGTLAFSGREGTNRLAIRRVAGRSLAAGSYTATITLRGSSAAARTVRFTVS
jgi:hypothetical protein